MPKTWEAALDWQEDYVGELLRGWNQPPTPKLGVHAARCTKGHKTRQADIDHQFDYPPEIVIKS